MPDASVMIELLDVCRRFGDKIAVRGIDLSVRGGELYCLLGPNGAGKTTTLKMLVGLLQPTSGSIRLGGRDVVRDLREAHRMLAYVPDEPVLYDKLTGREFLEFVGRMYGLPRERLDENLAREVERFDLSSFLDELCQGYSHGMKQRLVFASALIHDPEVLVVDEPMVGLDPRNVRLVKDLLRTLAERGVCVLMSTHTLSIAEEIGHRIGVIHRGRLLFDGSLAALREARSAGGASLEQLFLDMTAEPEASPSGDSREPETGRAEGVA